MSTQEFKVGQRVSDDDYDRLPVGAVTSGIEKTGETQWRKVDGPPMLQQPHATRVLTYLPDTPATEAYCVKDGQDGDWWVSEVTPEFGYGIVYSHDGTHPTRDHRLEDIEANFGIDAGPEPEDATDAYDEPEPLKEGDWVQVWAQISRPRSGSDTECRFFFGVKNADGTPKDSYDERVRNDAIVRPADEVPPWVKPVEEPLNIGSVVADHGDAVWARVATGDPGGPWWTRASEGPEESMTYPHHWGDLSVREVLSGGYVDGSAS